MSKSVRKETGENHSPLLDLLVKTVVENLPDNVSEEEASKAIEAAFGDLYEKGSIDLYAGLKRHIPKGIGSEARSRRGFEVRNQKRWGPAFDLLEMMIVCSGEHARSVSKIYGDDAVEAEDISFPAIRHLHSKAILISREILHLCRGGYPDGALARWRSLHEVSTIATFLKGNRQLSGRYLASFDFRAVKAAEQLNIFSDRANLQPFSEDEIREMKSRRDSHSIPDNLAADYEWARPGLNIPEKRPVRFSDIEERVGLDHWRPRYRWASQHTHAPYRPLNNTLGEAESVVPVFLIGPSNSGMVDPLQMTAISLSVADGAFFTLYPDVDRNIGLKVQMMAADEIGPLALKLQNETMTESRRPRRPRWFLRFTREVWNRVRQ